MATTREHKGTRQISSDQILVRTVQEAVMLLADEDEIGIDLETSGISPWRDRVAVITLYGERSNVAAILHVRGTIPVAFKEFFEKPGRLFIGHNLPFDLSFLYSHGLNVWNGQRYFDTLVASIVTTLTGRRNVKQSLDFVLERTLNVRIDKTLAGGHSWMVPELDENQIEYCLGDISYLPRLMRALQDKAASHGQKQALELEMSVFPSYVRMVCNGLHVDEKLFREYVTKNRRVAAEYQETITKLLGDINLNSPAQVKEALKKRGIDVTSTAKDALKEAVYGLEPGEEYEDENIDLDELLALIKRDLAANHADSSKPELLRYLTIRLLLGFKIAQQRVKMYGSVQVEKVGHGKDQRKTTYQDWYHRFVTNGFVHSTYWQVSTDTGRSTSSYPNLQQQPADIRQIFTAPEGFKIVAVDYSQIEVYTMGLLAGDRAMIQYLQSGDMHSKLAISMNQLKSADGSEMSIDEFRDKTHPDYAKRMQMRKKAKAATFALLFGGGYKRLYYYIRAQGGDVTLEEAMKITNDFFRLFPNFYAARQSAINRCKTARQITVELPSGLKRLLVGETLKYTTLLNTGVQGSAAAGMKLAIQKIQAEGLDKYMCAVVHDELVFIVPDDEVEFYKDRIQKLMEEGMVEMLSRMTRRDPGGIQAENAGINAKPQSGPSWKEAH